MWVSNHGGRQLDRVVATAHCVAPVRAAVGDEAEVYVDGGVRSGLDVLVATALGADAVFVGRPLFHALAAGGADGVARALDELGVGAGRVAAPRGLPVAGRDGGNRLSRQGIRRAEPALTCVNSRCDRGHSELDLTRVRRGP